MQASLGVSDADLGMRQAQDIALPAFISSRLESRHLVERLSTAISDLTSINVLRGFDSTTENAINDIRDSVSGPARVQINLLISEAWSDISTAGGNFDRRPRLLEGDALILPAEFEHLEHTCDENLQSRFCAILDQDRTTQVFDILEASRKDSSIRRIKELRDPSTSHDWLWALNPCHGPIGLSPSSRQQLNYE